MTDSENSQRAPDSSLVIGEWTVRPSLGELRRGDEAVHVEPKTMAVLLHLADRPRKVCSREDLLRTVWEDAFVTEEVLTHAVWELRRLLGDDARNPRYIQTVPKRGYRLVADVPRTEARLTADAAASAAATPLPADAFEAPSRKSTLLRWGATGLIVLGVAIALFWTAMHGNAPGPESRAVTSLAVLPLDNLMNDPEQQYFVDGMQEALISDLSKIGALKVISRTSTMRYRKTQKSIPEIAMELGVDALVEGSVLLADNNVRISAQLIDGATDEHLWADSYTRPLENVIALHTEASRAIARQIEVSVTADEADRMTRVTRVDPQAFQAFLRGLNEWNKRTAEGFEQAAGLFQEAIDIQPDYAQAWGGLANTYVLMGNYGTRERDPAYAAGRAAALRALEIDDSVAEALTALGVISYYHEWDKVKAEREFRHAIELRPNFATAHQYLAELLAFTGRHEEALDQIRIALALDPLSPIIASAGGEVHFLARRYDEAIAQLQRGLDIAPGFWRIHRQLGTVYYAQGRYAEAIQAVENGIALVGSDLREREDLGCAYAAAGRRDEALDLLEELMSQAPPRSWDIGLLSLCLGRTEQALTWLEQVVDEHSLFSLYFAGHPSLDPVRDEPRFQALIKRIGN